MNDASLIEKLSSDPRDPSPWLALYLDQSTPLPPPVKEALIKGLASRSRQFLLPVVRPLARALIILIQLFRIVVPNDFVSSRILHKLIHWGLRNFVRPDANYLILRHFHLGSEILAFIRDNAGLKNPPTLTPLKPLKLAEVEDDLFLKHDLNLFNFVIALNDALNAEGRMLEKVAKPDFSAIHDDPIPFAAFPDRWTNCIDVETAIEIYTPLYQLFLTDNDFWRATNSLQLDETIGLYAARILGNYEMLILVNNKHPFVPLATLRAGHRLVLHGVASESLHGLLVKMKAAYADGV